VERQRCELCRGAKGGVVWGRGVPLSTGGGSVSPPQKNFLDFKVKMPYFRGLCAKFRFFYDHNSIEIQH